MTSLSRCFLCTLALALLAPVANMQSSASSALVDASPKSAPSGTISVIAEATEGTGDGKRIYSERCAICHEASGMGPSLKGEKSRKTKAEAIAWIKNPRAPMPKLYPSPLSDKDVNDVAAYVETFPADASSMSQNAALSKAPNAIAAATAMGNVAEGKVLYGKNCAACHGAIGTEGGVGPSLKAEKSRKDQAAAIAWIKNPKPPMPKLYPSPLSEKNVDDVAAYIETL